MSDDKQTHRITLDLTVDKALGDPANWDWRNLLDLSPDDTIDINPKNPDPLTAAAPDMLAALQGIHSALYALRGMAENNCSAIRAVENITLAEWQGMEQLVRDAIEKATGVSNV